MLGDLEGKGIMNWKKKTKDQKEFTKLIKFTKA